MSTARPNSSGDVKKTPYNAGGLFRKNSLSIGRRLTVCFLLILVSMIAADAVVFWQLRQMVTPTRRLSSADQTSLALVRLRLDVGSFRKNVAALESSHDTKQFSTEAAEFRQSFLRDVEEAQEALSRAPEIAREDPTISATVKVLKVTLPSQLDAAVQLADAEDWAAVRLRLKTQIQQLIDLSSALVSNVGRQAEQEQSKAIEDVTSVQKRLSAVLLIAGLLTLLLAVALGAYVTQSITVPLAELGSGAEALASGDFHHEVHVGGNDELGVVGRAFNHAARQLQELYEELREQASLLSLTHDAIYVRDVKGVILYWNRGAEELYGWPAEYAVGEVAHELLKAVSPLPFEQIEAELLCTGRWQGELVKTKKDGTQIVVASRWSLKRDDRGEPVAILVTSNDITARKRAEDAARRSEKELRDVIETVPAMVWSSLPDGSLDFINHRWQEFTGLAGEDALGWNWEAVVHPDDHARFIADWRAALAAGQPIESEVRVRAANGEYRWLLVRNVPLRDELGKIVKWYGTSFDIHKRKRAEEALHRSEAYLAEAQKLTHTGSYAYDGRTNTFPYWSEEHFRIWGFDPQQGPPDGETLLQRVHPEDREMVRELSVKAMRERSDYIAEYRIVLPDGTVKYIEAIGHHVSTERGGPILVIGTHVDVTERKRAQEALRESETRFRTFVDHAGDALFVYDLEQQTVVDVNRSACEGLGYTRQELTGKTPLAFHLDSYQAEMESVAERAAAGETVFDTHWHRRRDGTVFPVEVHTSLISYGGRRFLLMVARDITDRLRAEEAVRQSEKQLREVIETIPAIAWTNSSDGSIEFVNKRWQEYTGISAEKSVGFGWEVALHPKDVDRYAEKRRASLASGDPFEDEVRIRCAGTGEYRWFLSRAVPLRDERGNIVRWYGTATDIHDRKRTEENLQHENVALREEIEQAWMFEEVVGHSPALRSVLSAVSKVSPTDSTVLLTGETGTGKELIARAIHKKSPRRSRAFVAVNCAAIPQSLIASELFGHEKGAFTGALQRRLGKFELAEGGTIFLDEVGELPLETQIALLRVLQEREFQRVGGSEPIRVNVRVLAATNRDLQKAIAAGAFRQDLFYRLEVFPIHIPPLRERVEDIPVLVEYFVARFARKAGKNIRSIEKEALELLESYPWPGNIRELENVIERSVIVSETETLTIDPSWLSIGNSHPQDPTGSLGKKSPAEEKELIERALAEAEGRVSGPSGAAAKLGIPASTLEYKIRLLKINKHQFKKYLRES
jgi:PAS domain S-box-containing protein